MMTRRAFAFALVGAGVALGAFAYWYYEQTLGYEPPPAPPLSQAQIHAARTEIRQAEQQVEQANRAAEAGLKPQLDLELHEEAINTLLNGQLADKLAGLGVHEPRVQVLPGSVVDAGAWVQRGGRRVWVSARLQLAANAGRVKVEPLEMRLGNMPMPQPMQRRLRERLDRRLDSLDLGLNGQQIRVESEQGVLRILTLK